MQNRNALKKTVLLTAASAMLSLVLVALPQAAVAQDRPGDPTAGGMQPGDYLRIGVGATVPINPQGSLRDWKTGTGLSVGYENWQSGGSGGIGRVGFGISAAYSRLPIKQDQFAKDFTTVTVADATGHAGLLEIATNLRIRIPAPLVMPSINIGLGFINWSPGEIHYTSIGGTTGSAKQQSRSGAELALGASVDRDLFDRYALFVEGAYVYGYTSYGSGFGTPTTICGSCDPLKNTTVATLRGGLRARIGR
ncbi:MAG TPA: hypothetical protein VGM82_08805 [Gemmatimonadaceae bacterium]|jgi:hypothetical protein